MFSKVNQPRAITALRGSRGVEIGTAIYFVSRIQEDGGIAGFGVDIPVAESKVDTSTGAGSNANPDPTSNEPQVLFSASGLAPNGAHSLTVINSGAGKKGGQNVELGKLL